MSEKFADRSIDVAPSPEAPDPAMPVAPSRTRRAVLAGALGGLASLVAAAIGRPSPVSAAPGDALRLGQANDSGTAQTTLTNAGLGAAFTLKTTNVSTNATGIFGWTSQTGTNATRGVYGKADGRNSYGVYGNQSGPAGNGLAAGVYGTSSAPDSNGVFGAATGSGVAAGVWGDSTSIDGFGVIGTNSGGGWSIVALGDALVDGALDVTGMVTKGGGSFKIDHPLDPANRYLYHSFVESPDMKNIYDGVAELGPDGTAEVTLQDWFGALNGDIRYQLTAIGAAAPDLHVSSQVRGNRFAIAGGGPGQIVSWQITGIRKDAWANANRIKVEVDKPAGERGRFLHPREHGRPSAGIDRAPGSRGGRA